MEFTNILKKGSKGNDVREMQTMLIACGFSCGPDGADGDFGKNTLAGLTAFQTANGLEATGIFDADTWAVLEKAYAAIPAPVVSACDVSKVLAVAVAEIGYKEKKSNSQLDDKTANAGSGNYTKYARDFDKKYPNWYNGKKNGFAWCDMFVDWCFLTAYGYENALRLLCQPEKSTGAGCKYSARFFKKKGQFYTSDPKPGDQIFFGSSMNDVPHTGLVEKVTKTKVYTIEGNTSNQVARREYALSSSKILGYGRPAYDTVSVEPQPVTPVVTPSEPVATADAERTIWDFLYAAIGNAYGVAGLMGNLRAESNLNPRNLQGTGNTRLGMTDDEFTAALDRGDYGADTFIHDGFGYGLAQWTYYSRKQALLNYANAAGVSIGDLGMQLCFLVQELKGYTGVWNKLINATSVRAASDAVLTGYEKPKDQSESVKVKRAGYSQTYYDKYAKTAAPVPTAPAETLPAAVVLTATESKYIHSTGTHYISNSGSDENKAYRGGKAGDQTGKEWQLKAWYNRPWSVILRYPDQAVALKIAQLSIAAALNDKIGYDQSQRTTYWEQLKAVGYDPSKITVACEEDCTAGVSANVMAAGYLFGIKALQNVGSCSSRNMRSKFTAAGFIVLTDSKYLTSGKYLLPGDILLYESHHAAANVTLGSAVKSTWNP